MKLIGSYTSPFVRKISILLLEKGIEFEFVNEQPYNAENGVAQYNPLGKVPALVTDEGDRLNLKSKLTQYLAMAKVFTHGNEIPEMDVVASEKEDMERLLEFVMMG